MSEKKPPMTWSDRAGQFAELAEAAAAAGDQVTMIVALQRAAECLQIHRNLNDAAAAPPGEA